MKKNLLLKLCVALCFAVLGCVDASAQFKEEAFKQSYNDDKAAPADSVDQIFSFKEYFRGLAHKTEIDATTTFTGSLFVPGGWQIYNKDYWKLPIVYGGMASTAAAGLYYKKQGNADMSKYMFIGTGLFYWASMLDGIISFKPDDYPSPGKATVYAILVPGLGQIYNHEIWKLPIYWGGMIGGAHFYFTNVKSYNRFRNIYLMASDPDTDYSGPISAETALYYRDVYRRMRDYSLLTIFGVYLLSVIDANVFSYMHNFEVSDDVSLDISPALIYPENQFAFTGSASPALGMTLGIRF